MIGLFFIGMAAIIVAAFIGWMIINKIIFKNKNESPKFDDLD
jgi:hypothetical protein